MSRPEMETIGVMAAVAAACSIPGVLLVLRRMVLVGDAISHVLLPGIVLAYFLVKDAASPILLLGAALSGVVTVALVEVLQRSRLIKEDAAIGLVFPAMFSVGVILVSMNLRNVHLDVDRVLLGSAELACINRIEILGFSLPRALVVLLTITLINLALLMLFFKELQLVIFDAALAASFGFLPFLLHYATMTIVSLTTVAAFEAVGSVLVLAFFAVPVATARLLTNRLVPLFLLSAIVGIITSIGGTMLAFRLDTTTAGTTTTLLGLVFCVVFCFAPNSGLVAQYVRRRRQVISLHETMLLIHLLTHENTPAEIDEASEANLPKHLAWTATNIKALVSAAKAKGLIITQNGTCRLTDIGRRSARQSTQTPSFIPITDRPGKFRDS